MVIWDIASSRKRKDGKLSVRFSGDGGEGHHVEGAPDLAEADLIAWFENMLAIEMELRAQEEAERIAREALEDA